MESEYQKKADLISRTYHKDKIMLKALEQLAKEHPDFGNSKVGEKLVEIQCKWKVMVLSVGDLGLLESKLEELSKERFIKYHGRGGTLPDDYLQWGRDLEKTAAQNFWKANKRLRKIYWGHLEGDEKMQDWRYIKKDEKMQNSGGGAGAGGPGLSMFEGTKIEDKIEEERILGSRIKKSARRVVYGIMIGIGLYAGAQSLDYLVTKGQLNKSGDCESAEMTLNPTNDIKERIRHLGKKIAAKNYISEFCHGGGPGPGGPGVRPAVK